LIARYLNKSVWPDREDGEGSDSNDSTTATAAVPTWQAYIDKMLIEKGNVAQGMIIDCKNGKLLASTPDFQLKKYETEIAQEDGTDRVEMVDEHQNIVKVDDDDDGDMVVSVSVVFIVVVVGVVGGGVVVGGGGVIIITTTLCNCIYL